MADVVKMPRLGESVTEGTVTVWFKHVGDHVDFDEPLFEVSTDKVDSEVPSPFEGTILEIMVPEGETVEVDTELARIGAAGDGPAAEPDGAAGAADAAAEPVDGPAAEPAGEPLSVAAAGGPAAVTGADGGGPGVLLSPVVRRLAAENGIDLAAVSGSGEGGRIMREDVEAAIANGTAARAAPAAPAPAAAPARAAAAPAAPAGVMSADGRSEVIPMTRIRQLTAESTGMSKRVAPHVWTSVEVDLENVEQIRQRHKDRFRKEEGVGLTYLVFIARAVCDALRKFPPLNSSIDLEAKQITLHHYVNLGIAVDLDEQGLIVPVIKDADALNMRGLARAIVAKATAARNRTLGADEITGSTFTITNPGPMGDYASAPIINQPNAAILSTNQVARRPTVVGDFVGIHHMTILGLSYNHAAFDGVTVSRFLAYVRDTLQDRDWEAELG